MRSAAKAVENRFVDWSRYPGGRLYRGKSRSYSLLSALLTTPVAYLSGLPEDPYGRNARPDPLPTFSYMAYRSDYLIVSPGPDGDSELDQASEVRRVGWRKGPAGEQVLFEPARELDSSPTALARFWANITYDPTNGARSHGDVIVSREGDRRPKKVSWIAWKRSRLNLDPPEPSIEDLRKEITKTSPPSATTQPVTVIHPIDRKEMALIPAGAFIAGTDARQVEHIVLAREKARAALYNQPGGRLDLPDELDGWDPLFEMIENEPVAHIETLPAFYMDRTEVTVGEFGRFLRETGYRPVFPPQSFGNAASESNPVVGVEPADAWTYARWAGKRLPTALEWEKAARGTDGRLYPWGNEWPPQGWVEAEPDLRTPWFGDHWPLGTPRPAPARHSRLLRPVGWRKWDVSPYGILGMASNATELIAARRELPAGPVPLLTNDGRNPERFGMAGSKGGVGAGNEDQSRGAAWSEIGLLHDNQAGPLLRGFRCVADSMPTTPLAVSVAISPNPLTQHDTRLLASGFRVLRGAQEDECVLAARVRMKGPSSSSQQMSLGPVKWRFFRLRQEGLALQPLYVDTSALLLHNLRPSGKDVSTRVTEPMKAPSSRQESLDTDFWDDSYGAYDTRRHRFLSVRELHLHSGKNEAASVESYTLKDDRLVCTPIDLRGGKAPLFRSRGTVVYDEKEDRLVLFGGAETRFPREAAAAIMNAPFPTEVWALTLEPGKEAWQALTVGGRPPQPCYGHVAVYDPKRHRMIVLGGLSPDSRPTSEGAILDFGSLQWEPFPVPADLAVVRALAVLDAGGRFVYYYSDGAIWRMDMESCVLTRLRPNGESIGPSRPLPSVWPPMLSRSYSPGTRAVVGDAMFMASVSDQDFADGFLDAATGDWLIFRPQATTYRFVLRSVK